MIGILCQVPLFSSSCTTQINGNFTGDIEFELSKSKSHGFELYKMTRIEELDICCWAFATIIFKTALLGVVTHHMSFFSTNYEDDDDSDSDTNIVAIPSNTQIINNATPTITTIPMKPHIPSIIPEPIKQKIVPIVPTASALPINDEQLHQQCNAILNSMNIQSDDHNDDCLFDSDSDDEPIIAITNRNTLSSPHNTSSNPTTTTATSRILAPPPPIIPIANTGTGTGTVTTRTVTTTNCVRPTTVIRTLPPSTAQRTKLKLPQKRKRPSSMTPNRGRNQTRAVSNGNGNDNVNSTTSLKGVGPNVSNQEMQDLLDFVLPTNQNQKAKAKRNSNSAIKSKRKKFKQNKSYKNNKNRYKLNGNAMSPLFRPDWKRNAGIVSTKVNNKQSPKSTPKSQLNIQQRSRFVDLRRKKVVDQRPFTEEEAKEFDALSGIVEAEKVVFRKWQRQFYNERDDRHPDHHDLTRFAKQHDAVQSVQSPSGSTTTEESRLKLMDLVKSQRFSYLAHFYLHSLTIRNVVQTILIKKEFFKKHYAAKYRVEMVQIPMHKVVGAEEQEQELGSTTMTMDEYKEGVFAEKGILEVLATLKTNGAKVPQWKVPQKYFDRKYNDQIRVDVLPAGLQVFAESTRCSMTTSAQVEAPKNEGESDDTATTGTGTGRGRGHVVYGETVPVSKDEVMQEILTTNPNSKDIEVVLDESVMSLLIDLDAKCKWRQSFMIPFLLKPNRSKSGAKVLFVDKQSLDKDWKRRYCNHSYFKRCFRSYLAQQFKKEQLQQYEDHLLYQQQQTKKCPLSTTEDLLPLMVAKEREWSEAMDEYSAHPAFTYSMCRLNSLHCIIRTQTYGQMTFSNHLRCNCYATVKLDYLNPHKQTFISHHDMKMDKPSSTSTSTTMTTTTTTMTSNAPKPREPSSLRTAEGTLYGVERWTESERLRLFVQCQLRSNHRLLIGRVAVPSRKLVSCNVVDPESLLVDDLEHIHLDTRYRNGLYLIQCLFRYLLTAPELKQNVQYLLAYDSSGDEMNIFVESTKLKREKKEDDVRKVESAKMEESVGDGDNECDIGIDAVTVTNSNSNSVQTQSAAELPKPGNIENGGKIDDEEEEEEEDFFDFHGYIDEFCGDLSCLERDEIEYVAPYPVMYRGTFASCHIPDLAPPATSDLPKPCQMFLFHGFCPKLFAANNGSVCAPKSNEAKKRETAADVDGVREHCEFPHYRTHILNHCWEYALYGGHCERGAQCEWPHLRQQELLNKGLQMFHVRQLINYCQDYYKSGMCKNSRSGGKCDCIHWGEHQLLQEFHTKFKWKQLRKEQLLERGRQLEANLAAFQKRQKMRSSKRGGKKGGGRRRRNRGSKQKQSTEKNKAMMNQNQNGPQH